MTLAEIVLPPSQAARALMIAAASLAILAAVWIFQGLGYQPCELCLTQRYAFYAAAPLAVLTAFAACRSAHGLARAGFALLAAAFVATPRSPPTTPGSNTTGGRDRPPALAPDRIARRQRPGEVARLVKVVRCDEVQLRIAGLSLAGWNVLASAALAVYAALAARL